MKLCSYPGCRNVVEGGGYRCHLHPAPLHTPKRRYDHHYHNGKAIYKTARWVALRERKLILNPLCEECARYGITTPAVVVDHIHEIKDGGDTWDIENLQSLCHSCHNRKTAKVARDRKKNKNFKSVNDY